MRKILTFKDFKGFKKINNINELYTFYKVLGKGSFGEVRKAEHIRAGVDCAVKVIKKRAIMQHQILVELM
jgi:serine/threonine protein kinase